MTEKSVFELEEERRAKAHKDRENRKLRSAARAKIWSKVRKVLWIVLALGVIAVFAKLVYDVIPQ